MAFMDEIGRKFTSIGDGGKGKASGDVARLTAQLNAEAAAIDDAYCKIGELYVARHAQDHEPVFNDLIQSISTSKSKVEELKKLILYARGLIRCEKCGADMPNTVTFCSSCGAQLPKVVPPVDEDKVRCEKCGAIHPKGVRFCTSCGGQIIDPTPPSPVLQPERPLTPQPEAQPPAAPSANQRSCPWCGAMNHEDVSFCVNCGRASDGSSKEIPRASERKKCAACGAVMEEDDVSFCTECGSPL